MPPPGARPTVRPWSARADPYRRRRSSPECADVPAVPQASCRAAAAALRSAPSARVRWPAAGRRSPQAASPRAPRWRPQTRTPQCLPACTASTRHPRSIVVGQLDLRRICGLDPGCAPIGTLAATGGARFDPATDPYRPPGERLQVETCRRKPTFVSLPDRDRKIARPTPAEVQVKGGATFVHRHHVAFNQREAPPFRHYTGRIVGAQGVIVRIGPEANLGVARRGLGAE